MELIISINLTNAANDGGNYSLGYKGCYTADLAYNTTAANMKVAFDSLPTMKEDPKGRLSSTFSATAVTDFTITLDRASGNVGDQVDAKDFDFRVNTLNDGTVVELQADEPSDSTPVVSGHTTGSFAIDLYAFRYVHSNELRGSFQRYED